MHFKKGTEVYTNDGDKVGDIERVVMNPRTKEVTHIVIEKGFLFTEDKVIPLDYVDAANPDRVILRQDNIDTDALVDFTDTHYLEVDDEDLPDPALPARATPFYHYQPIGTWWSYPGFYYDKAPYYVAVEEANIPEDTIAVQTGADVYSRSGEKVGSVERVLTDSETQRATHIIIAEGFLFKSRTSIPTYWIKTVTSDEIYLSVGSRTLNNLPEYEENPA